MSKGITNKEFLEFITLAIVAHYLWKNGYYGIVFYYIFVDLYLIKKEDISNL